MLRFPPFLMSQLFAFSSVSEHFRRRFAQVLVYLHDILYRSCVSVTEL